MMSEQDMMKISDLSRMTGIPISTIKYYAAEKLLPPPIKAGKTIFYYTPEHVKRLELIKTLKSENLPIRKIREIVENQQGCNEKGEEEPLIRQVKRDVILESAISTFREKGYNETTISDIVRDAGVGRNTFYVYFKNKEELFFECADYIFEDLDSAVAGLSDEENLLNRFRKRLKHFFDNPHFIDMMNLIRGSSVSNPAFRKKFIEILRIYIRPFRKDFEEAHAQGFFKDVDHILFGYLMMGLAEYSFHHFHNENSPTFEDLFQILADFMQYGLRVDKTRQDR